MRYSVRINHFKNSDIYQLADEITKTAFDKYFHIYTSILDDSNGMDAIRDHNYVATEIMDFVSDNINIFSNVPERTLKLVTDVTFLNEEVSQFIFSCIKLKAALILDDNK